jgi:hypothetical protein
LFGRWFFGGFVRLFVGLLGCSICRLGRGRFGELSGVRSACRLIRLPALVAGFAFDPGRSRLCDRSGDDSFLLT